MTRGCRVAIPPGHVVVPRAIHFSQEGRTLSTIGEDCYLLRWQAEEDDGR
jgi:hypothetical protein